MRIGAALLLLFPLFVPRAGAEEAAAVEAELEWKAGRIGPARSMTLPLKPEIPKGVTPPAGLTRARFARIRWGEGRGLAIALETAPGRETLFFDTDLDGALDDEEGHAWFGPTQAGQRSVRVRVHYADADAPLELEIRLSRGADWPIDRVRILPEVHRLGRVELGGRVRAVALLDDNADLRFDDPERDLAYVDLDGDGKLLTSTTSHERVKLGEPFLVGEEGWRLEVLSPSGRTIRFVRADAPKTQGPRRWPRTTPPKAGQVSTPPAEPLALLKERLESERFQAAGKRLDTIRKLGRVPSDEARDLLLALALRDSDVSVRAAAVRALGHPAWLDVVGPKLIAWSRSGQPKVAQAGLEALHGAAHPGRETVYREVLAGSSAAPVVGAAARHLAYMGSDASRVAVVKAYHAIVDPTTRYQIYLALRTLPKGPPGAVMIHAARSGHGPLAASALRDLQTLGDERAHRLALEAAHSDVMPEVLALALVDVLGARGDRESVEALLALPPGTSSRFEQRLVERLAAVRDESGLDALREALDAEEGRVRRLAAAILGHVPRPDVVQALIERLKKQAKKDEDGTVALLGALGEHADLVAVDVLIRHAKTGTGAVHQAAVRALARVGMKDERVRDFLLRLLRARSWEDRMLALDAAGAAGELSFLSEVVKNLRHSRWQVRLAAVEALGKLRVRDSIPPLIAHLDREEEHRVRGALAASLHGLTGMNLYDDASMWRRWWEEHQAGFTVPRSVAPLPPRHGGGTTAGFYGIPVRSNRIIFVLDQSGSMSAAFTYQTPSGTVIGTRLKIAIRELLEAVQSLGKKDRVNVILFHSTVHPWQEGLRKLTDANRKALGKHLSKQKPTGGTNIYDALEMALQDPDVKTVFLLSDGAPGAGKYVREDDILREVRRLNQTRRTAIHTIAVGMDSSLMRRLAEENGGVYIQEK